MRYFLGFGIALICVGIVGACVAGPLVPDRPSSLRRDIAEADVVVFGRFENARLSADGIKPGKTGFISHEVIKAHLLIKDRKVFVLPRYIPNPEKEKANLYVLFGDVRKDKLEFNKGFPADHRAVAYVRSLMKLDAKKPVEMLRFYLDHLEDANVKIAEDAHSELRQASHEARKEAVRTMSAKKILAWVADPEMPQYRRHVYASLLAYCGTPNDADELFGLLSKLKDDPTIRMSTDGYYVGILTLKPKEYFPRVKAIASDPKVRFQERYPILKAVRSLDESKSTALTKPQILELMTCILDQQDMADFAIEDFRKWKRWEMTDRVLKVLEKKSFQTPIIQKAVLRFALQSPQPAAAAFVAKMRKKDREWVEDTKELLDLETEYDAPPK